MIFEVSAFAVLATGFVLGLTHATDADHVVAVTTRVGEHKTLFRSAWIGVLWGVGHTVSLAIAGILVIFLKLPFPDWLASRLELVVAAMLILLGARAIMRWGHTRVQFHKHEHIHGNLTAETHTHWHFHGARSGAAQEHSGWMHYGLRPFAVGVVHGAAGSAALMLLVLSRIPSSWTAIFYILVFGAGSIAGMLLISLLLAAPLQLAKTFLTPVFNHIQLAAGLASCTFGIYLVSQVL
jgi:hypothetical protein